MRSDAAMAEAESILREWWKVVRPHPHRHGEYLMLTVEIKDVLARTYDWLDARNREREQVS